MKVPGILKNKYVFYALAALAVLNIVGYVSVQAWECLALFALTGYSAHCYCNNKACAILAALFVANFVFGCGRVKEGMEDMLKSAEDHMADVVVSADKASEKAETEGMREGADTCGAMAKQHCSSESDCQGAQVETGQPVHAMIQEMMPMEILLLKIHVKVNMM